MDSFVHATRARIQARTLAAPVVVRELVGLGLVVRGLVGLVLVVMVSGAIAQGQQALPAVGKAPYKAPSPTSTRTWTRPRTADGQPDLQGIWNNQTLTPFERPVELGTKATFTEQEAAEIEKQARQNQVERPPKPGDPGTYNLAWSEFGTKVTATRQTSLVVEPANGRVPVMPWAEAKRADDLAHVADSWEHMSTWDRCITRGFPAVMFPAGYNNAYQILQTPGQVVILSEMIHEVRVIPLDGRPHLASNVRQWNGDSRGHWEGDTLVVETTNYNNKGMIATSAATMRIRGIPQSEKLHVTERFRRVDAATIDYQVTIDDPEVYTAPWKVSVPLNRETDYRIYEYACHEGNQAMEGILKGGRAQEQAGKTK